MVIWAKKGTRHEGTLKLTDSVPNEQKLSCSCMYVIVE